MKRFLAFVGFIAATTVAPTPGHSQRAENEFIPMGDGLHYRLSIHRTLGFVRGITQTNDGYLWFATSAGLARYDGLTFTFFDSSNTPALREDTIFGLVRKRNDALWFVGEKGSLMERSPQGRFTHHAIPKGRITGLVCCLAIDSQENLWLGTVNDGVLRFANGKWDDAPAIAPNDIGPIDNIITNPRGQLLIRGGKAWWRIDNGVAQRLSDAESRNTRTLLSFIVPPGSAGPEAPMFDAIRDRQFSSIWIARDGAIWFAGSGLYRVTNTQTTEFGFDKGIASLNIQSLFEDRDGNQWVGHFGTGLTQMTRVPFQPLKTGPTGLAGGAAFSLAELDNGTVWLNGSGFLTVFRDGRLRNLIPSAQWPAWSIRSLAAGRGDWVWGNTTTSKIMRFNEEQVIELSIPDPLPDEFSTAIHVDSDDHLWAASSHGGLVVFENNVGRRLPLPELGPVGCPGPVSLDFPCPQAVNILVPRRGGGFWMGTHGKGMWFRAKDGSVTRMQGPQLENATIFALHEDEASLWAGSDRGLYRWPTQTPSPVALRLTRQDGLVSDGIFQILEDGIAQLWFGSDRGIFHLEKSALLLRMSGGIEKLDPVGYRAGDGVPSDEVIRRFEPHGLRSRDGRLWFALIGGLAIFNPPEKEPRPNPPGALLERIVLKNLRLTAPFPADSVSVPPGPGDLEFHYTAPVFSGAHRARFRYQLVGFDPMPVEAGTRRDAYYTNLPPGDYVFRVWGHSAEGGVSKIVASMAFTLQPQLHQTWQFYAGLAVLLIVLALGIQRYRIRQVKTRYAAVETERHRIARDLHDTLAQVFSAMGFQLDSVVGVASDETVKSRIKRVRQMVGHGRLAARNVILNLRSEQATSPPGRVLQTLLEAIPAVYDSTQIAVTVTGEPRVLPPGVENELFHIAQEAVSNAIEHGQANLVSIELEYASDKVELMVHDDGVGFANAPTGEGLGFGLKGMQERAQRAGGTITVHTEPGVGTEVDVVVTLPGKY
jgi:signal transduction histidine kinase/ligand-binding sensor domain-containing protein